MIDLPDETPARADSADATETHVLGAILLVPESIHEALDEGLRPEDFGDLQRREVFRAMVVCDLERRGMDLPALLDAMKVDGRPYVARLASLQEILDVTATNAYVRQHARTVRRWARARRASRMLDAARAKAPTSSADVEPWLDRIGAAALALADDRQSRSTAPLGETVADLVDRRLSPDRHPPERILSTPWRTLTQRSGGGLRPGQLIILAARPKVGKSALALALALHAGREGAVLFASLEMTRDEVSARAVSVLGQVDGEVSGGARPPRVLTFDDESTYDEGAALVEAARLAARLPIEVNDASGQTLTSIRAQARQMRSRGPLALIVVDYLQLVTPEDTGRETTREREVATIARGLKRLAKDCECPVLALSQLNRLADGERPKLSHLRESGALEQDANAIWFLHRDQPFDPDAVTERVELILAAQRGAASGGSIPMLYRGAWSLFVEEEPMPPTRPYYDHAPLGDAE